KYLPAPNADRIAEARGRQVLDKYNCAGCHQVRAGVWDMKVSAGTRADWTQQYEDFTQNALTGAPSDYGDDPLFKIHNAWNGPAPRSPERVLAFGVNWRPDPGVDAPEGQYLLDLTQALRVDPPRDAADPQVLNLPAGTNLKVNPRDLAGPYATPY